MTMRNTALLVTLVGLTLALLMQDCGEIHSVRSRLTTSLRRDNNDGIVTDTSKHPCTSTKACSSPTGGEESKEQDDTYYNSSFCSLVERALASQSPSQWWMTHFDDILTASQHPQDSHFVYRNWTTALLASLSPSMLQQGIRARPSGPAMDRVTDILYKRISNPQVSPPLQIAVVGGSVTRGQGCHEPILNGTRRFNPTLCAWPSRLERLINTLGGMELVQVYNLAVSATNLQFGTPLVKYLLYPQELLANGGPDVIVSSYSTNEQALHVDTTVSVKYANQERSRVQDFILAASGGGCQEDSPLVVFVDDYLGNRQDYILGEMTFNKVVTELAEWYSHVMHVSYADVIRRAIYANTNESIFTSPWPLEVSGEYRGQPKVEVHFGMGGHVAISWSMLHALVDVFAGYCDNNAFEARMIREGHAGVFSKQVLNLVGAVPPPELTPSLLLQNVSREWRENAARQQLECTENAPGQQSSTSPCVFAFLCGPDATVQNPQQLHDYMQPFLVSSNKGWEPLMEYGNGGNVEKPGLVAISANASMTMRFTNIDKEIKVINLQRIKSYGDKWAGSKARFTVTISYPVRTKKAPYETQFDVSGHHVYKSSISYPHEYNLKDHKAINGSNFTLSIDLVGGTTFKILGLMLCDN